MSSTPAIRLTTLGSVHVCAADGAELESLTAQPRRLGLLIYLALAQPRGFHRRDTLLALFWPEHDDQRARNALSQAVHFLRRTLGAETIVSGADDQLRIDPELVWCDASAFERALNAGHTEEALELYRGPFLEGFHISAAAPELDRWVDTQRDRLGRRYTLALQQMAEAREALGDFAGAVSWHRKLAALDPLSSRAALGLMRALAGAGETAAAIQHARIHQTLLREELQASSDPEIAAFVNELQSRSAESSLRYVRVPSTPNGISAAPRTLAVDVPPADAPSSPLPPAQTRSTRSRRTKQASLTVAGVLAAFLVFVPVANRKRADAASRISCVAVLPIENLSRDSSLEFFADALTGTAITELGHYDEPRPIARPSVMPFKRTPKPLPEIGRALNCDAVVEGSVTRIGNVVHIDVELLNAPSQRHLWGESYEADTNNLLPLARRVVDAVARHVRAAAGMNTPVEPPSWQVEPAVYRLYLRGRDAFRSRSTAALYLAANYFNLAIAQDSTFAAAYAGLADTYAYIAGPGSGPLTYADSARALAARALQLDITSSEAHTSAAGILASNGDWEHAEAEFQRAIQLEPGNALAHHWYATLLAILNRREEAVGEIRRARDLDPLSQPIQGVRLEMEFFAGVKTPLGNPGTVKGMVDRTHPGTHAARALQLASKGRCPEAYEANQQAQKLAPDNTMMLIGLVGVHVLCGDSTRARALLKQVEQRPNASSMGVYIAEVHLLLKQADSAFAWLDRSRWGLQTYYELRVGSRLQPLRSDPRYARLLARLHLPPQ